MGLNLKRTVYIASFTILGVLVSFLVHAIVEIWYIGRLIADFETYGLGLSWSQWVMIHHVGAVLLLLLGIMAGLVQGRMWWRIIYVDKRLERLFPSFKFRERF